MGKRGSNHHHGDTYVRVGGGAGGGSYIGKAASTVVSVGILTLGVVIGAASHARYAQSAGFGGSSSSNNNNASKQEPKKKPAFHIDKHATVTVSSTQYAKVTSSEYKTDGHKFDQCLNGDMTPHDKGYKGWSSDGSAATKLERMQQKELMNPIGTIVEKGA